MSSLVTDRYKAGELPRGWAEAQLDEIAEVILGQSPPGTSYNDEGRGMAFLQGKAEFGALRPTVRKWTTDPRKLAREDDVLLSVRAPVGPTNLAPTDCCIGRGLAAIRPRAGIDPIFVLYAIRATAPVLAAQATGSTFEAVTGAQVRAHRLPVPPLNEQRRIVAAIEEHLSRLDAADASLNVAAARIGGLRQAIVDSARHTSSRIEIRELLTEPLANGRSVVSAEQGFPVLRLSAMKDGFIDFDESKIGAWKASEAAPWTVRAGDFFVSRGNGSLRLVGRGALAGSPPKAIAFPDTLIRLRVDEARLLLSYLRIIWNTSELRRQVETQARTTAGIYKINQRMIEKLRIPLPPLDEQRRIVARVEEQLSAIDALRAAIDRAQRRSQSLRRAILERAFRGKLVPQDPSDEPAEHLLARLRTERGA